ncbi:ROK family protein [Chryseolinea sp. H1M3-3]|uniref:ROK family protein n=1 Tax=Chryseolinea sp. H1M3-3 TaxID=3034144 RepID=UPI0023EB00FC|nr:ROK family protein [Chryseolinea sp. H1M3-3]
MPVLGIDLGGTKVAVALFSESGLLLSKTAVPLDGRKGSEVGALIQMLVKDHLPKGIRSIGVAVPGISRHATGTVWAPNIEGWDDYPLKEKIEEVADGAPVTIDSDRACSILGEQWCGSAKGCKDAIFIAVGTGIGAGILVDGNVLRGAHDIAGAIGWMALTKPFENKYKSCGCFEFYASGTGIPKLAREVLSADSTASVLRIYPPDDLSARHVFEAFDEQDPLAHTIIRECISFWGMAAANLVSILNPEKIIFGGGIFGPASKFINDIKAAATKWAQPISITQVSFENALLGADASVYGAGFLAFKNQALNK